MWKHSSDPKRRYITEKLPFIPHRAEYGTEPIIWDTEIVIDFNTPEADAHIVYDEILKSKTDEFLVHEIIYEPIIHEGDDFGKWLISLYKIENGKIVAEYQTRYNCNGSLGIRFVRRMRITEVTQMQIDFWKIK